MSKCLHVYVSLCLLLSGSLWVSKLYNEMIYCQYNPITGKLVQPIEQPTNDKEVATKEYVDAQIGGVGTIKSAIVTSGSDSNPFFQGLTSGVQPVTSAPQTIVNQQGTDWTVVGNFDLTYNGTTPKLFKYTVDITYSCNSVGVIESFDLYLVYFNVLSQETKTRSLGDREKSLFLF